jgi:hypothetical protein
MMNYRLTIRIDLTLDWNTDVVAVADHVAAAVLFRLALQQRHALGVDAAVESSKF